MKRLIPILAVTLLAVASTVFAFEDDFERGGANWTGTWSVTTEDSHSPTHSITDSPGVQYGADINVSTAMASGEDLSEALGATLTFWAKWDTEEAFDFWYVEVSTNAGGNWFQLDARDGQHPDWTEMTYDLGGYVGNADVRIRFRLWSDGFVFGDGVHIDDVSIVALNEDVSPPLVVHTPVSENEAVAGDFDAVFTVTDVSGVDYVRLYYEVDGVAWPVFLEPTEVIGNDYHFTIPEAPAGTWISYLVEAADLAETPNTGEYGFWGYYCGTMLVFDDGEVDFIYQYAAGNSNAVRFDVESPTFLAGLLFRFYMDPTHGLDTVDVQVFNADGAHNPSTPILPDPLAVYPVNTPLQPYILTFADLRDYSIEVDGEFFGSCTYRSSFPVMCGTSPAVENRSLVNTGGGWSNPGVDFHIRALVGGSPPPLTIRDLQTNPALLGRNVTVRGIVTQPADVVHSIPTEVYIQDSTGYGVKLYRENRITNILRGDSLEVSGVLAEVDGMTQIGNFEYTVLNSANPLPGPIVLPTGEMAMLDSMEGSWAQVTGLLMEEPEANQSVFHLDDGTGLMETKIWFRTGIDMTAFHQFDAIRIDGVLVVGDDEVLEIQPSLVEDVTESDAVFAPNSLAAELNPANGVVHLVWWMGLAPDTADLENPHEVPSPYELDAFLGFHVYRDGTLIATTDDTACDDTLHASGTYVYTVTALFDAGESNPSNEAEVEYTSGVREGRWAGIPTEFAIAAAWPNPFNPTLNLVVAIPRATIGKAELIDILGRQVAVLHEGNWIPGYHQMAWNAGNSPTGIYFFRVSTNSNWQQVEKVVLIK